MDIFTPAPTAESFQNLDAMGSRLQDPSRLTPVVVISTPDGLFESRFDEAEVARAIRSFAELVVVPTGDLTRHPSGILGVKFGMFGGAARVYPTDPAWMADPYQAPLISLPAR